MYCFVNGFLFYSVNCVSSADFMFVTEILFSTDANELLANSDTARYTVPVKSIK